MQQFKETIVQGWEALLRHRMRSFLTMLGIVWGLASVVLLLAYGEGVGQSVVGAFLGIGNNVIMMWGGQTSMQAGGQRAGKRINFKYEDVLAIREEVPIVKAVSPESDDTFGFKRGDRVVSLSSKAIELPYAQMRRLEVEDGRYFEDSDFIEHRKVVILGSHAAKKVFQGSPPVGQQIEVEGQSFQVIGVLRNKIQDSSNNGPDNENAFIPFFCLRDLRNQRDPQMIVFQPVDATMNKKAIAAVREVLARRHQFDPKDDKAVPEWDTVENAQELGIFSIALDLVMGIVGALTLGVGGVGVMNIMLVSVTERTREIGLRKALGARPRHLLVQFLTESLVLTFLGGAVGMIVALIIAHLIPPMPLYSKMFETANHEGDIFLRPSSMVMISSFLILTIVGISSGLWPAMKASKMDPIDALRYE